MFLLSYCTTAAMTGNAGILSQDVSTRGGGLLLTDISHFLNSVYCSAE